MLLHTLFIRISSFNLFLLQYFVSECLGVGLVGPVVMVWAICSSLSSFITGRTSAYTSRTVVAMISSSTQAGLIVFMLLWEREASYIMAFTVTILWGYNDGIWQTLPSSEDPWNTGCSASQLYSLKCHDFIRSWLQ